MITLSRAPGRALTRIAALGAAAILTAGAGIGLALGPASPALAHDQLVNVDSEFSSDGSRFLLTLQFNNEVMNVGSEIIAETEDGSDAADGTPAVSGRDVTQSIIVPDPEQPVTVNWRVVSSDGHPIEGTVQILFDGENTSVSIGDPSAVEESATGASSSSSTDGASSEQHEHEHEHDSSDEGGENSGNGAAIALWIALVVVIIGAAGTAAVVAAKRKNRAGAGSGGAGSNAPETHASDADLSDGGEK